MVSYQAILEDLASNVERLDPAQYRMHASDAWHRMRVQDPDADGEHLGFVIYIGRGRLQGPNCLIHEDCWIEYLHRDAADDIFAHQGQQLDSGLDIVQLFTTWGIPGVSCRTRPEGMIPMDADGEFVKVRVPFQLHITEGRA